MFEPPNLDQNPLREGSSQSDVEAEEAVSFPDEALSFRRSRVIVQQSLHALVLENEDSRVLSLPRGFDRDYHMVTNSQVRSPEVAREVAQYFEAYIKGYLEGYHRKVNAALEYSQLCFLTGLSLVGAAAIGTQTTTCSLLALTAFVVGYACQKRASIIALHEQAFRQQVEQGWVIEPDEK